MFGGPTRAAFALAALSLAAAAQARADVRPAMPLSIGRLEVVPPAGKRVGSRKAGLLCLPAGSVRRADFVASDAEFREIVQAELGELGQAVSSANRPARQLSITLKAIHANLCARQYGLGRRTSLSGKTEFVFGWKLAGPSNGRSSDNETIDLSIDKADATTPREIFRAGVRQLLARIAPS